MRKVFVNGCFDVLHRGHLELLKYAKSLGDILYVAIDSDRRVGAAKGTTRPINATADRKFLLESIRYVDVVYVFDSKEELEGLIKGLNPDIMIVGSDWKGRTVIGSTFVEDIRFFERIGEYSTTAIIERFGDR